MWLPAFACPDCRRGLAGGFCRACGRAYVERAGIWRCLSEARLTALDPFMRYYRAVREREGRRRLEAAYYRALPVVEAADPHAAEWRIRRESYGHLLRACFAGAPQGARVLDLGAGCGWLSHRLAELGHRVVSVDVLDDEADGLGAVKHYAVRFPAVQADFDRLPFLPEQFDVVVFNGSLHYARSVDETLDQARRVVAPGGTLVVMDSPMFHSRRDGEAMVADRADPVHGIGYLTYQGLDAAAASFAMVSRFTRSRGPLGWRMRRHAARLRIRRAPAAFGVWVAQRLAQCLEERASEGLA